MDSKNEILRALRECRGSVSGQELSEQLGISRTAVWKHIRALQEEGYAIEAASKKGYRLVGVPDTIAAREVGSRLNTKRMGKTIYYFETIDSTNQYAKRIAEGEGSPGRGKGGMRPAHDGMADAFSAGDTAQALARDGTLIIADEQTAGKGRSGRHWVTPPKEAVAFSLILRPGLAPERISMVTLVMGLAVADAFRSLYGIDAGIKWPNDIVAKGKKLCGILTEMSAEIGEVHYIVIGVGINANLTAFPEEIRSIATSLKLETGKDINRAELIAKVMENFERLYEVFEKSGSLKELKGAYQAVCMNVDRPVRVLDPKGAYTGTARGIDDEGNLIVETGEGACRKVSSGEVSVRGIYGYV
jgi:BirA family biotin operon repressor/biotin-[acetyl-CoA-carboxylase] ligase